MPEDKVLETLRNMAWERAKGELKSMLHTFYGGLSKFPEMSERIDNFIADMEDHL